MTNINAVKRRVVLSGSAGTGPYAFTFEILDDDDIQVFKDTTLLTKTADYTVTINSNGTGSVTLGVAATSSHTITIIGARDIARTTDFVTAGDLKASSLNEQLDALTIFDQQIDEKVDRSLKGNFSDPTNLDYTIPSVDNRKGKYLQFNSTTGAPEAGPNSTDVTTLASVASDIAALADIEDGTTATDAISDLAAIKANVTTVAGVASNVTTVAGQTTNMANITNNLSAIQNAATNATTATTKASEAATSATNAASSATSAASSASTATTKASEASTSATNSASSASTASGHKDTATTKASEAASSATAAAASASTASTQASNASTSASTSSTQATNSASSATASANSATAAASSATAAASSATAAAASQTAAAASASSAASSFDSFDDRYLGPKSSDPSQDNDGNSLVSGALYFNSASNEMRVYDGANWIAATSAGNVSLILYEYTATAGQTTFSGSDDNSATLSYTADNLQVVMNGVILDPSDFTATNGTSVVLASGAATGDLINIYAFKSFTTADMVSKTNGGTFAGAVTVPQLNADNLRLDGNTISSTDTNGNVNIDPAGTGDTIIASGNLGIGTALPDTSLHISAASSARLRLEDTTNNVKADILVGDTSSVIGNASNHDLAFMTNDINRMTIDSVGNVGIGTGTVSANTKLHVNAGTNLNFEVENAGSTLRLSALNDARSANIPMQFASSSFQFISGNMQIGQSSTTTPGAGNTTSGIGIRGAIGDAFFSRSNGTAAYFNCNQDGNVLTVSRSGTGVGGINVNSSSATFITSSDYRLKENVTDMTGAINRVKALAPKRFNFIIDPDKTVDGFLAHEAQTVVPEAVTGTHNEVDDDGNAVMQGIDQSKLVPLLTAALKESIAKIETLETKVAALEAAQ